MQAKDIKVGETYLFVATTAVTRKHLEGQPFTVVNKRKVWRAQTSSRRHQVWRIFNDDGVGARPDELEPMPEGGICHVCGWTSGCLSCSLCHKPMCKTHTAGDGAYGPVCTECKHGLLPF